MTDFIAKKLSRRNVIAGAAVAAPAILSFGRGSFAQAQTTLSLGHGAAPNNPRHIAAEKFAEIVKEKDRWSRRHPGRAVGTAGR